MHSHSILDGWKRGAIDYQYLRYITMVAENGHVVTYCYVHPIQTDTRMFNVHSPVVPLEHIDDSIQLHFIRYLRRPVCHLNEIPAICSLAGFVEESTTITHFHILLSKVKARALRHTAAKRSMADVPRYRRLMIIISSGN